MRYQSAKLERCSVPESQTFLCMVGEFSFAHGGKDRQPFPVPLKSYDESIQFLLPHSTPQKWAIRISLTEYDVSISLSGRSKSGASRKRNSKLQLNMKRRFRSRSMAAPSSMMHPDGAFPVSRGSSKGSELLHSGRCRLTRTRVDFQFGHSSLAVLYEVDFKVNGFQNEESIFSGWVQLHW